MTFATELLGITAGTIVCVSGLPRIVQLAKEPGAAKGEAITRNAMLVAGNFLWVVYGVLSGSLAISAMCGVGGLLNGSILGMALWVRCARSDVSSSCAIYRKFRSLK